MSHLADMQFMQPSDEQIRQFKFLFCNTNKNIIATKLLFMQHEYKLASQRALTTESNATAMGKVTGGFIDGLREQNDQLIAHNGRLQQIYEKAFERLADKVMGMVRSSSVPEAPQVVSLEAAHNKRGGGVDSHQRNKRVKLALL